MNSSSSGGVGGPVVSDSLAGQSSGIGLGGQPHHVQHPHHHSHNLRSLNNHRTSSTTSTSFDLPFSGHLRESDTMRRRVGRNSVTGDGGASNNINGPHTLTESGPLSGADDGEPVLRGNPGQHQQIGSNTLPNHYNRHYQTHPQYTPDTGGYGQEATLQLELNPYTNSNSSAVTLDCQGYKPNAPHISGEWTRNEALAEEAQKYIVQGDMIAKNVQMTC